jgi:proteasome activator subunit 4
VSLTLEDKKEKNACFLPPVFFCFYRSDKYLDVRDLQLQWKPLYDVLEPELFPKQRATGLTTNYYTYFNLAEVANTYFPPHTTIEILETILPQLQGIDINTILSTQSLLCHFLPISHPLPWLDSIFRLWNTFQSQSWDSQWLDLLARLSHKHLDPNASDPRLEHILKNMKPGDNFDTHAREALSTFEGPENWSGIHRDVGIYTERQWSFIMTQCVRYFSVPVGSSTIQAAATYSAKVTDTKLASRVHKMLKPSDTLKSFAIIIVTSMTEDPDSGDCRALTSLSKLLTAMETFFHPSNHGRWSAKLAKFLNLLAKQFARRWSSESRTEQNTPARWKLTARIKMRFVSMLSNVLLMSMFSKDSTTATWTQHALKIAALLEPSVMVPPIVERSVLALEGLLEVNHFTKKGMFLLLCDHIFC